MVADIALPYIGLVLRGLNKALFYVSTMVADYSFDVKNIDIWAPAFFKHNNSFIAIMPSFESKRIKSNPIGSN